MNNREVAHKWANSGRDASGHGSHFFFEEGAIYSYGRHFKIAEFVKGHPGHVFFTRRTYSNSTSKHLNYTRQAIGAHLRVWAVADGAGGFYDHRANVAAYLDIMETSRASMLKARTNANIYRDAAERAAINAGEYVMEFGAGGSRSLKARALKAAELARSGSLFSAEELLAVRERVAKAREANREQARKREEADAAKRAELMTELDAWTRGEGAAPSRWDLPTRLRINGERVETSRGAQITLRAARLLWVALCDERGQEIVGKELDGYKVRSWDGAALVVGCHSIPASELVRLAGLLQLPGTLAAPQGA